MEIKTMGMDVYGQEPDNKRGEYFRASIWSWPAIYSLTTMLCSDLLDDATIRDMSINCGAGTKDASVCKQMAARLREWLGKTQAGFTAYVEHEHTLAGQLEAQLRKVGPEGDRTSRHASHDHLEEWIEFLEHCGGFEVW